MPRARRRGTRLEGAVAVVTLAAGQIGRRLFADLESRSDVVVGLDLADACPDGDPRFVPCDVTDDEAVRTAFAEVGRRRAAGIDLLVIAARPGGVA